MPNARELKRVGLPARPEIGRLGLRGFALLVSGVTHLTVLAGASTAASRLQLESGKYRLRPR
jgi:hypothetical protein